MAMPGPRAARPALAAGPVAAWSVAVALLLAGCSTDPDDPELPGDCEDVDADGYTPDEECAAGRPLDCDCETWGCEDQLDTGPIDVYKVHHHGSYNGSSNALLDAMMPSVALIPVGLDNSYGHPHAATLARLRAHGADVWRTDRDGDVRVVIDDGGIEVDTP